jgi:pyruvate dehydrogenase E1 component alpha subunit
VKKIRETRDCIARFAEKVTSAGLLEIAEIKAIDHEVMILIDDSVVKAKAGAKPGSSDLLTDVYVSY